MTAVAYVNVNTLSISVTKQNGDSVGHLRSADSDP
jgi:hypothetical protein